MPGSTGETVCRARLTQLVPKAWRGSRARPRQVRSTRWARLLLEIPRGISHRSDDGTSLQRQTVHAPARDAPVI